MEENFNSERIEEEQTPQELIQRFKEFLEENNDPHFTRIDWEKVENPDTQIDKSFLELLKSYFTLKERIQADKTKVTFEEVETLLARAQQESPRVDSYLLAALYSFIQVDIIHPLGADF